MTISESFFSKRIFDSPYGFLCFWKRELDDVRKKKEKISLLIVLVNSGKSNLHVGFVWKGWVFFSPQEFHYSHAAETRRAFNAYSVLASSTCLGILLNKRNVLHLW